jgi:hypothetical protein
VLSFIIVALATLAWALTAHAAVPSIDSSFAMVHYYFTGSKIPHLNAKVSSSVSLRSLYHPLAPRSCDRSKVRSENQPTVKFMVGFRIGTPHRIRQALCAPIRSISVYVCRTGVRCWRGTGTGRRPLTLPSGPLVRAAPRRSKAKSRLRFVGPEAPRNATTQT